MALFSRTPVPAALRSLLEGHERVLAVADAGDTTVIATQLGLWLPDEAAAGWRRIGWHLIVKATWANDALTVIEGEVDDAGVVSDRPPVAIRLDQPRNVPSVVRTRVEASIARSEQVNVPGGTGRVVARRVPGVDGLTWTARLDSDTPASQAAYETLARYRLSAVEASQDAGDVA